VQPMIVVVLLKTVSISMIRLSPFLSALSAYSAVNNNLFGSGVSAD
jgi:hypothetical protein